jgi:hypothetical protein
MTLLNRKVSVLVKFNVLFVMLFGIGWLALAHWCYKVLQSNAQEQVMSQAQLIMDWAIATRSYTTDEVETIALRMGAKSNTFLPQAVPDYAAVATFRYLADRFPGYQYKEPALNPTNLLDEPTPWEKNVIQLFRANPEKKTDRGDVPEAGEPKYYMARRLRVEQSCLSCHSTPEDAPPSMTARYGRTYGFKWKVNDVVAAQVVIVPQKVQSDKARKDFLRLSAYLAVMFVLIVGIVDVALVFVIIRPIRTLLSRTDLISKGYVVKEHVRVKGEDEIADLGRCFNRLQDTITAVVKLLEHTKELQ